MAPTKVPNQPRGTTHGQSSQQVVSFTIRARPLPDLILCFILDNLSIIKALERKMAHMQAHQEETQELDYVGRNPTVSPENFWEAFAEKCKEAGSEWEELADRTWSFGPQKAGGCLLVDARKPRAYSS
jgi:ribosome assembly protein 1